MVRCCPAIIFFLLLAIAPVHAASMQAAEEFQRLSRDYPQGQGLSTLSISHPLDNALFPADMASPVVSWKDDTPGAVSWLAGIEAGSLEPVCVQTDNREWYPEKDDWEKIKAASINAPARVTVIGLDESGWPLSCGRAVFSTSPDPVKDAVLWRQVGPELTTSPRIYSQLKWRLGDVSSYGKPRVIMENLTVCASCHMVTPDGKTFSMEIDYQGDKGAQAVTPISPDMELSDLDFMFWSDFPRPKEFGRALGLFGKLSPKGDYVVATVHEKLLGVSTSVERYSQLFLVTRGKIGLYSTRTEDFRLLPGADRDDLIQTDPSWSPDQSELVFAAAPVDESIVEAVEAGEVPNGTETIHRLNEKYEIKYGLYRLPFNQGRGGSPEPLAGACDKGFSNYFARYSPDGKWIVFTRSDTGIMLQPGSRLFIVPAGGGEAREMNCNLAEFNSWHSWSSNGRWLLFSSKANTQYTEIFLTHVDEQGVDSVPVLVSRFKEKGYAANVPEFVNIKPDSLTEIRLSDNLQ